MRPLFAFAATLVPLPGDSVAACFEKLAAALAEWAAESGGTTERGRADAAEYAAADVPLTMAGLEFKQSAAVGRNRVVVQCVVTVRGEGEPFCPTVVNKLLKHATALVGGRPVSGDVTHANKLVAVAVGDAVLDPARTLPLVVLSPDPVTGKPLADPETVMDELYGLADVVELANTDATFALTHRVGKEWSCFHGAARIYWPGADPETDSPYRHPLFFPNQYPGDDGPALLVEELFRRLALAAATRGAEPPVVREARTAVAAARRAEDDAKLAALTAGAAQASSCKPRWPSPRPSGRSSPRTATWRCSRPRSSSATWPKSASSTRPSTAN